MWKGMTGRKAGERGSRWRRRWLRVKNRIVRRSQGAHGDRQRRVRGRRAALLPAPCDERMTARGCSMAGHAKRKQAAEGRDAAGAAVTGGRSAGAGADAAAAGSVNDAKDLTGGKPSPRKKTAKKR